MRIKKLWVCVVIFLLSVACLGAAYYMIIDNGLFLLDRQFFGSLILGSIGTVLFFLSLSGFCYGSQKGINASTIRAEHVCPTPAQQQN